jgi:dipeptidyl aminopeptidase/acylaminoacyl peptidase
LDQQGFHGRDPEGNLPTDPELFFGRRITWEKGSLADFTSGNKPMIEKQVLFTVRRQKLYGMLHLPKGRQPFPAISMFHGFTGQRIESHQLFVKTARKLALAGLAVLRFDFRGSGESEGNFFNMTISGEIEDALASLDFLSQQPEVNKNRLGVLGLSMGGFVASYAAARNSRVKALALWAAGARASTMFPTYIHLSKKHEEAWLKTGKVDLAGNLLGINFLKNLKNLGDAFPLLKNFKGKALVVHGGRDSIVPVSESVLYKNKKVLGRQATLRIIKGADHTFNRKDWEKTVIDTTISWFKKNL